MTETTTRPQDPAGILAAKIVAAVAALTAVTAVAWQLDATLPPLTPHAISVLALYWLCAATWTLERAHRDSPIVGPGAIGF